MATSETIGDRIRKRRKELKLAVRDLARAVELAPSTVYDIENGHQDSSTKLHRFAELLRVNVRWLETGTGSRDPDAAPAPNAAVAWGFSLTQEAAELGWQWSLLDEEQRAAIQLVVYDLVGKSKRKERKAARNPRDTRTAVHDEPTAYKT